jgi:hypothetical protein
MTYHSYLAAFTRIFVVSEDLRHDAIESEATPQEHPRFAVLCCGRISKTYTTQKLVRHNTLETKVSHCDSNKTTGPRNSLVIISKCSSRANHSSLFSILKRYEGQRLAFILHDQLIVLRKPPKFELYKEIFKECSCPRT